MTDTAGAHAARPGAPEHMPGNDDKHEFEAALAHAQQVAWPR